MITTSTTINQSFSQSNCPGQAEIHSLDVYLSWMSKSGNSEKTVEGRRKSLSRTIDELGINCIEQLTSEQVQKWIEYRADQGSASRSVKSRLLELQHFCKWLSTSGWILSNPIAGFHFEVDDSESIDRFQLRFQRLFLAIQYISTCRLGATLEMINELQSGLSHVCLRTTRRDMDLLTTLGIVRKERVDTVDLVLYRYNTLSGFRNILKG